MQNWRREAKYPGRGIKGWKTFLPIWCKHGCCRSCPHRSSGTPVPVSPERSSSDSVGCLFTKSLTHRSEGALKRLAGDLSRRAQCWGQVKELFQRQEKIKSTFSSESYAMCLIKKKQQHPEGNCSSVLWSSSSGRLRFGEVNLYNRGLQNKQAELFSN